MDISEGYRVSYRFKSLGLLLALAACDLDDATAAIGSVSGYQGSGEVPRSLHVLGDSFTAAPALQEALASELPGWTVTFDGVGGSSLAEQEARYRARPDSWSRPLVILDGGLSDPDPLLHVERIGARAGCWFYVEPVPVSAPSNVAGAPGYEKRKSRVAAIRAKYPARFIPSLEPLQREAKDFDEVDLQNGWAPVSLRVDRIHLSNRGYAILARQIAARVKRGC